MSEPRTISTVLGNHAFAEPLRTGALSRPGIALELHEVRPVHRAFAPMVRHQAYDLCELAVVTCLQAFAYDRPVVVLPAVVASRFQRPCLVAHASRPVADPRDLAGGRVGVRAYTQTTGMWVRAHLAEDYGLTSGSIRWVTQEGAHVEQYQDPPQVERGLEDVSLVDALRNGDVDAAVFGNDLPEGDEFVPVIADAVDRDTAWSQRHGGRPINHLVVASRALCEQDAGAVRAAFELLRAADEAVRPPDGSGPTRFGARAVTSALEVAAHACVEQELVPRPLSADEVLAPARDLLGDAFL